VNTINALGFVEVYGLTAGIEAADAMLKSAQVRLLRQYGVRPGLITLTVEGDLAACRVAVDVGVAAASRIGRVIASNVIARPDEDTETMVLTLIAGPPSGVAPQSECPPEQGETAALSGTRPQAGSPAEEGKPPPAKKVKAPALPDQKPGTPADVLAFIAKAQRGRSWHEIVKHFPDHARELREELDARVASGELNKVGIRYRKP